jgi:hypothetical protein
MSIFDTLMKMIKREALNNNKEYRQKRDEAGLSTNRWSLLKQCVRPLIYRGYDGCMCAWVCSGMLAMVKAARGTGMCCCSFSFSSLLLLLPHPLLPLFSVPFPVSFPVSVPAYFSLSYIRPWCGLAPLLLQLPPSMLTRSGRTFTSLHNNRAAATLMATTLAGQRGQITSGAAWRSFADIDNVVAVAPAPSASMDAADFTAPVVLKPGLEKRGRRPGSAVMLPRAVATRLRFFMMLTGATQPRLMPDRRSSDFDELWKRWQDPANFMPETLPAADDPMWHSEYACICASELVVTSLVVLASDFLHNACICFCWPMQNTPRSL